MSESSKSSDFEEHQRTYDGFLRLTKWSIVTIAIVLVLLYFIVIA